MSTASAPTDHEAEIRRRLAEVVPPEDLEAAWAAYEQASISGLCHEGAWEIAIGTHRPNSSRRDTRQAR